MPRCELRRVLDCYFNVRLGVSQLRNRTRLNLVLNSTGRRDQAVNVCVYLLFFFYLLVAWFMALSLLPEVDKRSEGSISVVTK